MAQQQPRGTTIEEVDENHSELIKNIIEVKNNEVIEGMIKTFVKRNGLIKTVKLYNSIIHKRLTKLETAKEEEITRTILKIFEDCGMDKTKNLLMQATIIEQPQDSHKMIKNKNKRSAEEDTNEKPTIIHENKKKKRNDDDPNLPVSIRRKTISQQLVDSDDNPRGWYILKKMETYPRIIVNTGKEKIEEVFGNIKSFFDNNSIKVGVMKSIFKRNDHIDIYSLNMTEAEKVYNSIKENFKDLDIKWNSPSDPTIRIINVEVPEGMTKELLIKQIKFMNDWPEKANVAVSHWSRFENKSNYAISLQVAPTIRTQIENMKGIIKFNGKFYKAADCFNIKICKKCFVFGHWTGNCDQQTRCPCCTKCHKPHCSPNSDKTKWYCQECRMYGHSILSRNCEKYLFKLNTLIMSINYSYQWIMAPVNKYD